MNVADAAQRARALDPLTSFCVSAPAGSGKTELLIQRYLCLLARVERPEQVLAITFTRKAAAEMRGRVVAALCDARSGETPCGSEHQRVTRDLARQALAADARGEWHLVRDVARLNIRTIDGFCGSLIRQMPVLSAFGGQANVLEDPAPLYTRAVAGLFQRVDGDHPVAADLAALLLHFDNDWERLQKLLVALLARREQWRRYVGLHHQPHEAAAYLEAAVTDLVRGELNPLVSGLAPYSGQLLELLQFAAANLAQSPSDHFPGSDPADLDAWAPLRTLLLTRSGTWRQRVDKTMGFPAGRGLAAERKARLGELLAELRGIDGLEQALAATAILPRPDQDSASWQLLLHLSRLLPVLAAELLLVFQQEGTVDHSQVALSALDALGDDDAPTELALRLDYRIEHILVDEFQDTAVNQYELVQALTRGWGEHNADNPGAPRTVMVVGDGMQSIYGFRGANVGLFLKARLEGFNGVPLEPLQLRCNFRSSEGIVDWVNATFSDAFPARDDIHRGRVSFVPAMAVRPAASPAVSLHGFLGEGAQDREVAFLCRQIAEAQADPDCGSVAVLARSRNHLVPVLAELRARAVPFNAQAMDSLADAPAVTDLLSLCRALASDADRLAWMALLRAPWCGLGLADLLCIGRYGESPQHQGIWQALQDPALLQRLSAAGRTRVDALLPVLAEARDRRDRLGLRVWVERAWTGLGGPACVADATALADAERFMQLLERAESEGIGLDIPWLERNLRLQFMSMGEADAKVQLMTLHKAKGLEFDTVFIPQLARPPRRADRELLLWDEHSSARGERIFLLAADDHSAEAEPTLYNYLARLRRDKSLLEGTRLLYVGATRAARRLVLSASLGTDASGAPRAPAGGSLLHAIWPAFREGMQVHEETATTPAAPAASPRTRLLRVRRPPAATVATPAPDGGRTAPARPLNHRERSVGTVVHQAMDELSRLDPLPQRPARSDRLRWRSALASLGLWGAALDDALAEVERAVATTLADTAGGRWLLSTRHARARSEWALTQLDPATGAAEDLVIDRSFVDADSGLRWLIDYKNASPLAGECTSDFCARQADLYRAQLLRYREALRTLGPEPLRCALYFTSLGRLYHLPELDLAGWKEP